jgi:hypothetical protein
MEITSFAPTALIGVICLAIGYMFGVGAEKKQYSFRVTSFSNRKKRKIPGIRSEAYEYGYRAQLHVKGFPCLEPHVVILEEGKEFDCDPAEMGRTIREIVRAAVATKTCGIPYIIEGALEDHTESYKTFPISAVAKASDRKTR